MSGEFHSYAEAIAFLYGRINYERADSQAYSTSDFKLDRMRMLLALIGNPQERMPAVHVAGTKGKGSTCSMIAAVLNAAGLRVGLYISPHISSFEERMTVNAVRPTPAELVGLVNRILPAVAEMDQMNGQMQPTYFELATALAWLYFEDRDCEYVVLETGLGGRLDSTNICRPLVCVITNISRDHTHILGSTIRQIAWEKGGIIKPGIPVVSGVSQPDAISQIQNLCRERSAPLYLLGREINWKNRRTLADTTADVRQTLDFDSQAIEESCRSKDMAFGWVDVQTPRSYWKQVPIVLRGVHQSANAALALAAIDELRNQKCQISRDQVYQGLECVEWPARVEVVANSPTVIVDAAHNWESARALIATLREEFRSRRRILIFAATRDKDVTGLLRLLVPEFDTVILTRYLDNPRSVPVQEMLDFVQLVSNRRVQSAETPEMAWKMARRFADPSDLIAITGSFFLVAELRDKILKSGFDATETNPQP